MRKIALQMCFFIVLNIVYLFFLPLLHMHGIVAKESSVYFIGVSISISVFLGFRNNTAWLRYWEARKLWGDLLIASRSLIREVINTTPAHEEDIKVVVELIISWCLTLKSRLRHEAIPAITDSVFLSRHSQEYQHITTPCNALLQDIGLWLYQNRPNEFVYRNINNYLNEFSRIQGGCERISNTPIPFAYSLLLHRTVGVFCAIYPLLLINNFGVLTLLFSVFTTYALLALDAIATELEDPFGSEDNDLPLNAICNAIEIDLREMVRDSRLPEKMMPDKYYRLL
ncbi:bestrophin family protein [Mixta intestinalis]|nr:bestrophin family ion channel [Mixta intestinalis]